MEEKIKKQKIAIIILSALLTISFLTVIGFSIYNKIEKSSYLVSVVKHYNTQNNAYEIFEIEILSNEEKIIKVNDFTSKHDGQNVIVSKIVYDGKEYNNEENFAIKANISNVLVIYISQLSNDIEATIYFKWESLKLGETKKFH